LAVLVLSGLLLGLGALPAQAAEPPLPKVEPDAPATAMSLTRPIANNSPVIVADPTNSRFVVLANRIDGPDFSCALELSGDGGHSWAPANPVPKLPEGAEKCYAPEVDFDSHGMLYYLFVGLAGNGNRPMGSFLTTSTDRGRTFSPPQMLLGPLNFTVRMAIDRSMGRRGRIHMIWTHATNDVVLGGFGAPPNPVLAAHSDDGGRTFSPPVQVSDPERERVVGPALALGPHHAVHVVYYDLGGDARDYQGLEGPVYDQRWSLVEATSTDGGNRFGPGVVVDDQIAPSERILLIFTMPPPGVAVRPDGEVCVAWTDGRFGDPDVLLRCSSHHGRTWVQPVRLNRDKQGNGLNQYLPRLAASKGGRLDAVYFDRQNDPNNTLNDVTYSYSTDGGRHFSVPVRLDQVSSDSQVGPRYAGAAAQGLVEFGSRLGLLATPKTAVAAWTDTRNSERSAAQDVYFTQVDHPAPGRAIWMILLGIAAAIAVVALALAMYRKRSGGSSAPSALPEPAGSATGTGRL